MKDFLRLPFNSEKCRRELEAFDGILQATETLSERGTLQPFFKANQQLSVFMGELTYPLSVSHGLQLAYEFPIFGDFSADIVVGSRELGSFCLVELEEAGVDSIFTSVGKRATKEWGRRFERGFSQLVDWFYALDDLKNTKKFVKDFGHGHVRFSGFLVIGRNAGISDADRARFQWRTEKVRVDSHSIECLTYDDLCQVLRRKIGLYPQASALE